MRPLQKTGMDMTDWAGAAVLGLTQGLTEFLPVSSSAHLVFVQRLLGMREPELVLDVVLHGGTLLAVLIFFRARIAGILRGLGRGLSQWGRGGGPGGAWRAEEGFRTAALIMLASIPVALAGSLMEGFFERLFGSPVFAAGMLLVTGIVLFSTRWLKSGTRSLGGLRWQDALLAGCAQAAALFPGISRSGATLSALTARKLDRDAVFQFAFLMSVPAVAGALGFELRRLTEAKGAVCGPVLLGFCIAALSGYGALLLLRRVVRRGRLDCFAYYCWAAGLVALFMAAG